MSDPIIVEIVGLKYSDCSPFPCDADRTCGLSECHPSGKLTKAFDALKAVIKETYGDRLAFCGGLGVQSVLPFGTPDEVRAHVRETIDTLGRGGGLIIGPSHVLERDTPIENIFAMVEAMDTYGVY